MSGHRRQPQRHLLPLTAVLHGTGEFNRVLITCYKAGYTVFTWSLGNTIPGGFSTL